jgi:predicted dehydrogenase
LDLVKIRYNGHLLIEKPLFEETKILPEHIPQHTFVAYNLRFHPVVRKLIDLTKDRDIYSIQAYVGQYLPQWRPHMSYTKCYSAYRTQGGGVLRDLSHELDYITLITGGWYRVSAIGGRFSKLKIESDDLFCLLLETPRCPAVTIQMNYLDRKARRKLIVNCSDFSIRADLINNEIEVNAETIRYRNDRNTTYRDQHRAVLDGRTAELCTVQEGMAVLNLIEKAETAAAESIWTYR